MLAIFNQSTHKSPHTDRADIENKIVSSTSCGSSRLHDVKRAKDGDAIPKLFAAYLRRAGESELGSALVELTILLTSARQQTTQVLNDAAAIYKVDTAAIAAKVRQEFAAKEKAKKTAQRAAKAARNAG